MRAYPYRWLDSVEDARVGGEGHNGAYRFVRGGARLMVISSDGLGWEHVSISLKTRCPTWPEMCFVKDLFWEKNEAVMQLHPAHKANTSTAIRSALAPVATHGGRDSIAAIISIACQMLTKRFRNEYNLSILPHSMRPQRRPAILVSKVQGAVGAGL